MDIPNDLASQNLRERFFSLFDHLSLIKALSQIEIDAKGEEEIIKIALTELMRYQVLDSCSLFRLSEGKLDCVAGISMDEFHEEISGTSVEPPKVERVMQFAMDEGIMGVAVRTGEMQYCRDCSNSKEFLKASLNGKVPGSLICIPVKMGGEVLAILNASHSLKDFFEPWQQHGLSLFGSYLGQILHNHRLIHNLEQKVDERTRELRVALEESEHLKRRYQQLSIEDELTGLHNRRYFFTEAEAMVSRAMRYGQSCSLMLLDVDFFKQINDKWGHVVGDRVLCLIARVLKEEARGGDLVARVGGEEFVIILPDAGMEGADLMARRIQERLGRLELGGDLGTLGVTVSIGISYLLSERSYDDNPVMALDKLYSGADQAMYECKTKGRNCRRFYTVPEPAT